MGLSAEAIRNLSSSQRRALLAELLRQQATPPAVDRAEFSRPSTRTRSKFSLLGESSAPPLEELRVEIDAHPFLRFVNPYRGQLYRRIRMDKQFVAGEGCYFRDESGNRYLDFTAQYGALPSIPAGTVLRIEPPLIVGEHECDTFIAALARTLEILDRGDTAQLLAFLVGGDFPPPVPVTVQSSGPHRNTPSLQSEFDTQDSRFAFVIHLTSENDYARLDSGLSAFDTNQLRELRKQVIRFLDPFVVRSITVAGTNGRKTQGEYVLIPHTAEELMTMPHDDAVAQVTLAVEIAKERGAEVVGLGGFTSIVTQGGLALSGDHLPLVTSGNSYTVVAMKQGVEQACRDRGQSLADLAIAIVGGAGMIGQALALLLAEEAGRLVLIGNPKDPRGVESGYRTSRER